MSKYKKCDHIREEIGLTRCDAYCPQKEDRGICSKRHAPYRITASCWKVPSE